MLKRTLFFFAYISFFILIPVIVYYSGSNVNLVEETMKGQHEMIYGADDSLVTDSIDPAALGYNTGDYSDLVSTFSSIASFVRSSIAVAICFPLSILFCFIIALNRFFNPKNKTGGLITAICFFNVFYIPGYVLILILKTWVFSYYYLIMIYGLLGTTAGKIILVLLGLLFIATIILTILGKIRGKRLADQSSEATIVQ